MGHGRRRAALHVEGLFLNIFYIVISIKISELLLPVVLMNLLCSSIVVVSVPVLTRSELPKYL